MGSGFSKMKKQAKMLEQQFSKMQEELQTIEVTGEAGNGLVKITLSGDRKMKKISIDKECVDPEDVEALEDLIQAAYTEAAKQVDEKDPMNNAAGAFPMPF